jgi:steroid Delta-isomerase
MDNINPTAAVALAAMRAVGAGDRDAWLACYADDVVIYDPVGGSPLDLDGTGLRGHEALTQFWNLMVAPRSVTFTVAATHPAGNEVAVVASVRSVGAADEPEVAYDGVFVYRINADGRIAELRAYWDLASVLATLNRT